MEWIDGITVVLLALSAVFLLGILLELMSANATLKTVVREYKIGRSQQERDVNRIVRMIDSVRPRGT